MTLDQSAPIILAPSHLDALTAMSFKRAAREHLLRGSHDLVLDLSSLSAIDASGIAAVLSLSRSARAAGGRIVTRGGSPEIKSAFTLTGLESLFAEA
jgi:anti-anti-sigma factor